MSTVRTRPECDFPAKIVLYLFLLPSYGLAMADHDEKLFPATTEDVADALAFALRFYTRNRVNSATSTWRRSQRRVLSQTFYEDEKGRDLAARLCGKDRKLFGQRWAWIEGKPRLSFPHHVDQFNA